MGRENNATAGVVCPADVQAAFNFEFDDIDVDVPLGELLVEASKETPRWRVMLTPLPGARVRQTASPRQGAETGSSSSAALPGNTRLGRACGDALHSWGGGRGIGDQRSRIPELRAKPPMSPPLTRRTQSNRGLTGRTGVHPSLNIAYSTGPTNCLARTR